MERSQWTGVHLRDDLQIDISSPLRGRILLAADGKRTHLHVASILSERADLTEIGLIAWILARIETCYIGYCNFIWGNGQYSRRRLFTAPMSDIMIVILFWLGFALCISSHGFCEWPDVLWCFLSDISCSAGLCTVDSTPSLRAHQSDNLSSPKTCGITRCGDLEFKLVCRLVSFYASLIDPGDQASPLRAACSPTSHVAFRSLVFHFLCLCRRWNSVLVLAMPN